MNIFYHNYTALPYNDHLPEVLRARYISLPGKKEEQYYNVVLSSFLCLYSYSAENEVWRFAGEKGFWKKKINNTLLLFPPGTALEFKTIPGEWSHGMMLYFNNGNSAGLDTLFPKGEKVLELEDQKGIYGNIMKEIAMLKTGENFWEARLKLLELLFQIHSQCKKSSLSHTAFADNVDNLLRKTLNRPVSRKEIASELQISISLLSHRYRKERGISVMQKHLEMRLEQAKELLLNGETIQRSSVLSGFSSPFHLSRAFKKYYGKPPAKYAEEFLKRNTRKLF